ncbi:MAG: hypothetical protein SGI73_02350 [Chloroflexota bacterium]|nr:hypothetical protein [Chloroflexota bacterium]
MTPMKNVTSVVNSNVGNARIAGTLNESAPRPPPTRAACRRRNADEGSRHFNW